MKIKSIKSVDFENAIDIFTEAFINDPLFIFAFPDLENRKRLTRIMYEFVVLELVPEMKLKLIGLFENEKPVSAGTYTTPESTTGWTDKLDKAVKEMWIKANDNSIRLIGEYSMESKNFNLKEPHFYFNELAVLPKEQGKGHGKAMFKYVESKCLKHPSAKGIALDTPNPENVKIYKHLGYKVVHKFKFHYLTGYTMYKEI